MSRNSDCLESPLPPESGEGGDNFFRTLFDDEYCMRRALLQAQKAFDEGEVPVGAVATREGRIVASAYNQVETLKDATAHAEIILITKLSALLGDWRLSDCEIYVTKEPCPMCAGAIVNSRIRRLVFAAKDPRFGAAGGAFNLFSIKDLPSRPTVVQGVLEEEAKTLLQDFFRARRSSSANFQECNLSGLGSSSSKILSPSKRRKS